jgi:hypothetical protein
MNKLKSTEVKSAEPKGVAHWSTFAQMDDVLKS